MAAVGESRTELLQWLNELLQLNYSKVEQCGTGGAYCQIVDSIYGDVPMQKVKMNAKHEYEFLANYKVMQMFFKQKKIDKPIPVEKLVKCKMQDNLEFLQWMKRYWLSNYGGQPYDAVARRRGAPTDTPATIAPLRAGPGLSASTSGGIKGGTRAGSATSGVSAEQLASAQAQVREMSAHLEGLEKERDFYFAKVRFWGGLFGCLLPSHSVDFHLTLMMLLNCSFEILRSWRSNRWRCLRLKEKTTTRYVRSRRFCTRPRRDSKYRRPQR
ncbi:hypothetical protein FRC12_003038 [Ceratobasidium sp. 428]|nr:hypothetical protein FRC12_003038 [Ceratobasidium sp. 428]